MKLIKQTAIIVIICILGIAYIICSDWKEDAGETLSSEFMEETIVSEETEPETVLLYVQVCGAVNNPGVYEVPQGARVCQVIELAGGMREDAGETGINQAAAVSDGQQIYVPAIGEETIVNNPIMADSNEKLININQASIEELMTLPGIGQAKAEAIIDYRESGKKFETIEDIMNVSGIKEAAFNKIKEKICV